MGATREQLTWEDPVQNPGWAQGEEPRAIHRWLRHGL